MLIKKVEAEYGPVRVGMDIGVWDLWVLFPLEVDRSCQRVNGNDDEGDDLECVIVLVQDVWVALKALKVTN